MITLQMFMSEMISRYQNIDYIYNVL